MSLLDSQNKIISTRSGPEQAHVVQFYMSDGSLLNRLSRTFAHALERGESVIAVMTRGHQKGLRRRLSTAGVDLDALTRSGRLTILDAADCLRKFMTEYGPDRERFVAEVEKLLYRAERAAEAKEKRVVVFGEMVSVLWGLKEYEAAIRLEQFWNDMARTHFFHLHCAYPIRGFKELQSEHYSRVCAEHSVVVHV